MAEVLERYTKSAWSAILVRITRTSQGWAHTQVLEDGVLSREFSTCISCGGHTQEPMWHRCSRFC